MGLDDDPPCFAGSSNIEVLGNFSKELKSVLRGCMSEIFIDLIYLLIN